MKNRHRHVDPAKARAAAGGIGWYAAIPVDDNRATCSRCGTCDTPSATVGERGGSCLRCRLREKAEARKA